MLFQIESERALLEAFRPRDRKVVEVPRGTKFPLTVRDYFAWQDPYGARTFLVFRSENGGPLVGIAFRRDQQPGEGFSAHVCEWCRANGGSDQIGLLTTDVTSARRIGVNVCLDLRCKEKLDVISDLSGQSPRELMKQVLDRMERFAAEGLGMAVGPGATVR